MKIFLSEILCCIALLVLSSCAGKNQNEAPPTSKKSGETKDMDKTKGDVVKNDLKTPVVTDKKVSVSVLPGSMMDYEKRGYVFTKKFKPLTKAEVKGVYDFKKHIETDKFVIKHFKGVSANSLVGGFKHLKTDSQIRLVNLSLRKSHRTVILTPKGKFYSHNRYNLGLLFEPIRTSEAAKEFFSFLLGRGSYNYDIKGYGIIIKDKNQLDSLVGSMKKSCKKEFVVKKSKSMGLKIARIKLGFKLDILYYSNHTIIHESLIILKNNSIGTKREIVVSLLKIFPMYVLNSDRHIANAPPMFNMPKLTKAQAEKAAKKEKKMKEYKDYKRCISSVVKKSILKRKELLITNLRLRQKKDKKWQFPPAL